MDIEIHEAVRDGIARAVAAVGLAGVALIHLLDLPGQLSEAPLVFGLYVALMLASVALAAAVIWRSDTRAWAMAAVLPALVIVAYVLSRTSGLPGSTDDIGNWSEPLGMASLFVEGALVVLSSAVLVSRSEVAVTGGHTSRRQALQRAREGTAAPAQRSAGP